jgi:photosystem II stability/assembly factor-like uncharacterized protein
MHKKIIGIAIAWLIIMAGTLSAQDYTWDDISRGNYGTQVVLVNPRENRVIFAGIAGSVLKSNDAGEGWRRVLAVRSGLNNINALGFDRSNLSIIYAATDKGLYRSKDSGEHWENFFRGKNNRGEQCTAVLSTSRAVFVGTRTGLFISRDDGRSWRKESGRINNAAVFNIDSNFRQDSIIFLAAACGIFRSLDNGENWERVFVGYSYENNNEDPVDIEEVDEKKGLPAIRFVKADANNINCVYFSGDRGVYRSLDQGKSWMKLGEYGLLNRDVRMLGLSGSSQVFALTQSGVFLYEQEHWKEVSSGLTAGKLNYFDLDNKGTIYIAGEKGIFKASQGNLYGAAGQMLTQEYIRYEPKIREVQKAAIKYAEVDPEKISQWRKKAAKKAILPKLGIGLERNSSDLWHWESGSTAIGQSGDDLLRRGRDNLDWDVTLSWDLGELIWNADQTSIDVRSKLMVELRDDILDEVNKLYFERLRVKSELDNLPIEDRKKRFDKELKLEELTASLDSLTAGYYSEQSRLIMSKK